MNSTRRLCQFILLSLVGNITHWDVIFLAQYTCLPSCALWRSTMSIDRRSQFYNGGPFIHSTPWLQLMTPSLHMTSNLFSTYCNSISSIRYQRSTRLSACFIGNSYVHLSVTCYGSSPSSSHEIEVSRRGHSTGHLSFKLILFWCASLSHRPKLQRHA